MSEQPTIIILEESLAVSIIKDLTTFVMFLAMIGTGVALDSAPMQWIGAVFWLVWLGSQALSRAARHRMSVTEARAKLDEIERRAAE